MTANEADNFANRPTVYYNDISDGMVKGNLIKILDNGYFLIWFPDSGNFRKVNYVLVTTNAPK